MSETTYQVTLAIDGKHAVSVQGDDPAAVTEGLVWAQETYRKLVRLGATPQGSSNGRASRDIVEATAQHRRVDAETEAPICAVHDVPMVWQKGRRGYFWSCHEKNPDGVWCSFRPV